jgi:hypothetical protein
MIDPNTPLSVIEKQTFGPDARRHPVTGHPLEMGSGALSELEQGYNHLRVILQTEGKAAADAMRGKLNAYYTTLTGSPPKPAVGG